MTLNNQPLQQKNSFYYVKLVICMDLFCRLYCTIKRFLYADFENLDSDWIKIKLWCQISKQAKNIGLVSYPSPTTSIRHIAIFRWVLYCDKISNNACAWFRRKGLIWPLLWSLYYSRIRIVNNTKHPCIQMLNRFMTSTQGLTRRG